jgi:RNA polymerase sigma factor (sigma-70 family)
VTRLADTAVPEETLAQARAGDQAARAAIYAALAPATFALIRRMMMLYERLPQFRREAPLGAWLRQIAISRCLMYLRSPWRRARLCLEGVELHAAEDEACLVTPAYRGDSIDVERALASLGPTARAVVWMYEVEGYSHQEIAREFGRSVSFSKSQLARAHVRLRAWFAPQEDRPSCNLI